MQSMVGYVLGLGDRHPSNLMLDRKSGAVMHVDFGDCFEVAMQRYVCVVIFYFYFSGAYASLVLWFVSEEDLESIANCVQSQVPGEGTLPPYTHACFRHGSQRH